MLGRLGRLFETRDGRALPEASSWLLAHGFERVELSAKDRTDASVEVRKGNLRIRFWSEKGDWYIGAQPVGIDLRWPVLDTWGQCLGFESGLYDEVNRLPPLDRRSFAAMPFLEDHVRVLMRSADLLVAACEPDRVVATTACLRAQAAASRERFLRRIGYQQPQGE